MATLLTPSLSNSFNGFRHSFTVPIQLLYPVRTTSRSQERCYVSMVNLILSLHLTNHLRWGRPKGLSYV